MERFLKRHQGRIKGIISGFDRILFKGTLRSIAYSSGLEAWLASRKILQKDFAAFAQILTDKIIAHAQQMAEQQGRPYEYLASSKETKEDRALEIAQRHQIREGLVCILSCVEPCRSFRHARLSAQKNHFGMKSVDRKCLHLYFYFLDRDFGLMHVRLQTWFPFTLQVCLNGWEWLAHQLERADIPYEKRDNCFAHIQDLVRAQQLMDRLFQKKWVPLLNRLARLVNPWFTADNPLDLKPYYWTIRQCEYATDVLFQDAPALQTVYPRLLQHAIHHFGCKDVLRFLARRIRPQFFQGEVKTEFRVRVEATRIKHWVEENSIKMYDKQACVLRVETTINNPRRWKVWRRTTHKGKTRRTWIPMRQGLADIQRRAQISRAANARYLDALSVVGDSRPASQVLDPVAQRRLRNGRSYRPLHVLEPSDAALLAVISSGQFLINGFRNKDLNPLLYPDAQTHSVTRRQSSQRLSRRLRLLKEHRLIYRVHRTNLYRLTTTGFSITAVACKLRSFNVLENSS